MLLNVFAIFLKNHIIFQRSCFTIFNNVKSGTMVKKTNANSENCICRKLHLINNSLKLTLCLLIDRISLKSSTEIQTVLQRHILNIIRTVKRWNKSSTYCGKVFIWLLLCTRFHNYIIDWTGRRGEGWGRDPLMAIPVTVFVVNSLSMVDILQYNWAITLNAHQRLQNEILLDSFLTCSFIHKTFCWRYFLLDSGAKKCKTILWRCLWTS